MKKINYFAIRKIAICLLCCLLMITIIGRPITANATGVETAVAIGFGGASASVALPILAVVLVVVVITNCVNLDEIVSTATNWYNGSNIIKEWADSAAKKIAAGQNVIPIEEAWKASLRKNAEKNTPEYLPYIYLPSDFSNLENLTQEQLFGADAGSLLQTNNDLTAESNSLLSQLKSDFKNSLETLQIKISTFYTDVGSALTTMNNNMMKRLDGIKTTVNETKSALAYRIDNIPLKLDAVKTGISTSISELTESITYRVDNFKTTISNDNEELKEKLVALPGNIALGLDNAFVSLESAIKDAIPNSGGGTPPTDYENNLMNNAQNGGNKVHAVVGMGKDLISNYGPALLAVGAVLTKFINVPVVGDLIYFSLALGIFALAVNLGNMILSNSESDAKGKRQYSNKGYSSVKGG